MKKQTLTVLLGCWLSAALFFTPVLEAQTSGAVKPPVAAQQKVENAAAAQAETRGAENDAAISINGASAAEMAAALNGIGLKKAQAIVDYREQNGAFTQIEQLKEVQGIGNAIIERNRDKLKL